jgi:HAD superfamily phosphoserine phosphatase-like hydrolase
VTRVEAGRRRGPLPDPPRSSIETPVAVPALVRGLPPLAILVDYDGTIASADVSDALLAEFTTAEWASHVAEYQTGDLGSRRVRAWEVGLISADPALLRAKAAAQRHDPSFPTFAERARAAGVPVEVVSDGLGFFIEPALEALGVGWLPVVTSSTTFGEGQGARVPRIEFPNGDPHCFVCGTCKRNRVLAHQAAGRSVVFVGDGPSDRFAAGYADLVFAKDALVDICLAAGWPFERWTDFSELDAWLARTLAAFEADPSSIAAPRARPLFCGAEVWGPGRFDPA